MLNRLIALALVALFVACGQVSSSTYKPTDGYYSRDDGFWLNSDYDLVHISNGAATGMEIEVSTGNVSAPDIATTDDFTVGDDLTVTDDAEINGNITLENDEVLKNDNDGEIELGNGTEDTAFSWGTDAVVLTSDTGVVELDVAAVGTTLKLANDQTIVSDTDNEVQIGDNSEDISFGFGTANECTVTTDTGVTRIDAGDIGIKTSVPLFILSEQHFCGQGANGTTATYVGPVLKSAAADETTYVFGAAGCDGLDNTTEATADAPLDRVGAFEVHGMTCTINGGTDDVYTFQLRDDAADVTGATCNVTLDGAYQTCSVLLDAPVTVANASALAVKQVAATDDDCSACDTECFIYFSY